MIKKVNDKIWKLNNDSNIYLISHENSFIAIDAGNKDYFDNIKKEISEVVKDKKVKAVILTHLHYDHCGCLDLFPGAEVYASKEAIEDYDNDSFKSILGEDYLKNINLKELPPSIFGMKVFNTPGHTKGSVCLHFGKIMFSGDTLFFKEL